jgi:hypothetical protein
MKGDFHVRFRGNAGVKLPCVTRLSVRFWSKKIELQDDIIDSKQRRLLNQVRQDIRVKHYRLMIYQGGKSIKSPNLILVSLEEESTCTLF